MRKTPPGAGWTKSPSPVLQGQSAEPTTAQRTATYHGKGIGRCPEGAKCYTYSVALAVVALTLLGIMPAASSSPQYRYVITPTPDASARSGSPIIRRVELNKQHFSSHDQIRRKRGEGHQS